MIASIFALLAFATVAQAERDPDLSPACDPGQYTSIRVLTRENENTVNGFLGDASAYSKAKKEIYEAIYQCVQATELYRKTCEAALGKQRADRNLDLQMDRAAKAAKLNCREGLGRSQSDLHRNSENIQYSLHRMGSISGFSGSPKAQICSLDVEDFREKLGKAVKQKEHDLQNVEQRCPPRAN